MKKIIIGFVLLALVLGGYLVFNKDLETKNEKSSASGFRGPSGPPSVKGPAGLPPASTP
jgi:hypothetical protein